MSVLERIRGALISDGPEELSPLDVLDGVRTGSIPLPPNVPQSELIDEATEGHLVATPQPRDRF